MSNTSRWRVFHVKGPAPPPDVEALLGRSGVWTRMGDDDLWVCPGGTTYLTWPDMIHEWGPYFECPNYQREMQRWEHPAQHCECGHLRQGHRPECDMCECQQFVLCSEHPGVPAWRLEVEPSLYSVSWPMNPPPGTSPPLGVSE